MPGCMASSTKRTFSDTDQRRRRCTEVMTSTRRSGSSELLDIVVLIGACLCLLGYADCPVKMGCAPGPRSNRYLRLYRGLLQPNPPPQPYWRHQSRGVRNRRGMRLRNVCQTGGSPLRQNLAELLLRFNHLLCRSGPNLFPLLVRE